MKLSFLIISAVLILGDVQGQGPPITTMIIPSFPPPPPTPGPEIRPNPNQQPGQVDLLNNNVLTNSSMIVDLIINIIMNGSDESRINLTTSLPTTTWRSTVDGAPTGTTPNFSTTSRTTVSNTPFPPTTLVVS